jgi:hypothetical protein
LSVAVAGLTVNNASYLGGTAAGSYQLNSTLAANVAQLTANAATYINANTGIISNATGVFVNAAYINTLTSNVANYINANTGIVSNATGVYVNAAYINTISSNYASYANLASYINANTGIISNATGVYVNPLYIATLLANAAAYIPAGDGLVSNSFGVYVIGNTGIVANSTGVFVNAAYINTISSNLAYYVVANSGIVSNATGVFVNQGTGLVVNSSGVHVNTAYVASISSNYASYANLASYIPANTGIVSNATGVFVNASYINTISSNLAYYVIANTGLISNATGVHVNAAYINTISSNLAYYLGSAGISANTTVLILANTVGISANGSLGTNGQVLTSNGSVAYWAAAGSTGTVSKVYSRTSAAAGQNTFTTSSAFIAGAVDVYLNGVHLSNADFSEINTTTVQLAVNCSAGQIVEIVGYQPSAVTGNVTYGVSISTLSGDGSTVAFGLTTANVTTNSAFVYINGVKQNPGNSYNISANVITFSAAPANNDLIEIQIPQILNATVNTTNIIAIVGNNTVQYGNIAYEVANSTTGNTLSSTVVDSYDATAYRTAKYVVQVTDNSANNYQADEIMLLHDGTNVYITVYGELITNTTIATFDASLVSNNVRLLVTSTSNATIKVHRTMLTV